MVLYQEPYARRCASLFVKQIRNWQTELFVFAVVMAVILEGSRVLNWRWDLSDSNFNRIWDLCAFLFLGVAVYCYLTDQASSTLLFLLQWSPLIFLPFMMAQAYSLRERVSSRTFSWLQRRRKPAPTDAPESGVNISYL